MRIQHRRAYHCWEVNNWEIYRKIEGWEIYIWIYGLQYHRNIDSRRACVEKTNRSSGEENKKRSRCIIFSWPDAASTLWIPHHNGMSWKLIEMCVKCLLSKLLIISRRSTYCVEPHYSMTSTLRIMWFIICQGDVSVFATRGEHEGVATHEVEGESPK